MANSVSVSVSNFVLGSGLDVGVGGCVGIGAGNGRGVGAGCCGGVGCGSGYIFFCHYHGQ